MASRATRAAACAVLGAALGAGLSAQSLPDDQTRRDAIRYYRAGQELMAAERFDKAAEQFSKAVQRDSLFTLAHYSLGQAYMNLQRFPSAIVAYEGCINATRALHGLIQEHRVSVEHARADEIVELKDTIRRMQAQANRSPGSGLGLRVTQLERHLTDLERERTSIEGPFHPPAEVLLALGSAFFRNEQEQDAEVQWRAAADANPKLGEAHNNLAVVYIRTGRLDAAARELTLAEKAGYRVNPRLKLDLKSAMERR